MAEDVDLLISLAELAGVFVGFASLVILIGSGADTSPGSARSQIKIVVAIGVMVFIDACMPSTLWRARASNMANLKSAFPDYYLVRPAHFRACRRRLCKGGV